jgi:phospholipase/lecithinase/hemolysin
LFPFLLLLDWNSQEFFDSWTGQRQLCTTSTPSKICSGCGLDILAHADPLLAPDNIVTALNRMYDELGARTIVVPNLFDVGRMPLIGAAGPEAQGAFHQLTLLHNSLLQGFVAAFLAGHPDVTVIPVDVFSVVEETISDFVDPTGSCLLASSPLQPELPTCDDFFFLDVVHP